MPPAPKVVQILTEKLERAFAPCAVTVTDDSAAHAGHSGARAEGQTHFTARIVSPAFEGVTRLERQRRVHAALAVELRGPVHALAIKALTPSEAASAGA